MNPWLVSDWLPLAFAGFLRFDELANIKVCDLSFSLRHLTIQPPCNKFDQLCHGSEVVIARTDTESQCWKLT